MALNSIFSAAHMSHGKKLKNKESKLSKTKNISSKNKWINKCPIKTVLEAHSVEGNVTFVCLKSNDESTKWQTNCVLKKVF